MTILQQYDAAWRHFDMIAKQRISSFNHYLIILGVLLTASAAVKLGPMHAVILGFLGVANMAAPVLFWALDKRICRLLANLKDTLYQLEETSEWPAIFKPFHRDALEQQGAFNKATTYSGVFWTIFLGHFVLGFVLLLYAVGCPKATVPTPAVQAPQAGIPLQSVQTPTVAAPPMQPSGNGPSGIQTQTLPPQK
jgi:hypothetical protein